MLDFANRIFFLGHYRRAVTEHGDVLDVLLQKHRDTGAAKRFFRRLLEENELPQDIITDGLRSYEVELAGFDKLPRR